jgi:hypothetical protein
MAGGARILRYYFNPDLSMFVELRNVLDWTLENPVAFVVSQPSRTTPAT